MRLIVFVTEGTRIRKTLDHIGVDSEPLQISAARWRPLWDDDGDAQVGGGCRGRAGLGSGSTRLIARSISVNG